MTKIEPITFPAVAVYKLAARPQVATRASLESKVVPISSSGMALTPPVARKQHIGRKGREVLEQRRTVDGAFLTVALGAMALLWWSTL